MEKGNSGFRAVEREWKGEDGRAVEREDAASRVGYTFEYINVCNFEAVLEWASAILSGGY